MLEKRMLVLPILMFSIFVLVMPAFATPIFHDYGSDSGKIDPGGNDPVYADYVKIWDNSSSRFYDNFDFSDMGFEEIDSFDLTLDFSDTGDTIFFGLLPTEDWNARPAGDNGSGLLFDMYNSQARTQQTFSFNSNNLDVFDEIIDNQSFGLWFAEETGSWTGADSFKLYSASLDINGTQTAPVPEPATILLLGAGLGGLVTVRGRKSRKV